MTTATPMKIAAGRTYVNEDPNVSPAWMANARVTVKRIGPDDGSSLNVSYSFVARNGQSGEGTMRQDHAERYLVEERLRSVSPEGLLAVIGSFPSGPGFDWSRVGNFVEEAPGRWEPYSDGEILPGPSIFVTVRAGE